jgi:hypothetical protein
VSVPRSAARRAARCSSGARPAKKLRRPAGRNAASHPLTPTSSHQRQQLAAVVPSGSRAREGREHLGASWTLMSVFDLAYESGPQQARRLLSP